MKDLRLTNEQKNKLKKLTKGAIYVGAITSCVVGFSEIAYAKFDVDAGVTAATGPIIKGIGDHWGKGVLIAASGAALY